jgi:hypothetical protein
MKTLPGRKHKIDKLFSMENRKAKYTYDFGDDWEDSIELEKILLRDKNIDYPVCVGGERACPPEDCGSIPDYERLCRIMNDKESEEMFTWISKIYNPEHFDLKEVCFGDPDKWFKMAFFKRKLFKN